MDYKSIIKLTFLLLYFFTYNIIAEAVMRQVIAPNGRVRWVDDAPAAPAFRSGWVHAPRIAPAIHAVAPVVIGGGGAMAPLMPPPVFGAMMAPAPGAALFHAILIAPPPPIFGVGVLGGGIAPVGGALPVGLGGVGVMPVGGGPIGGVGGAPVGGGMPAGLGGVVAMPVGGGPIGGVGGTPLGIYISPLSNSLPQQAMADTLFQQLQASTLEIKIDDRNYKIALDDNNINIEQGVVWSKVFYLSSNHKASIGTLGYNSGQIGTMFGIDKRLKTGLIIGIAYTGVNSSIKFKDDKNGNSHEFNTNMATIYGMYKFNSDLFINGQLKYGLASINTTSIYGNRTLYGDSTAYILGNNLEIGRNIQLYSPIIFTPKLGISYGEVRVPGFKEEGNGFDTNISRRIERKAIVTPGIGLKSVINNKYSVVIPEIHFNMNHAFYIKNSLPRINVVINNTNNYINISKEEAIRTNYVIGACFNIVKHKTVEFGFGYDYTVTPDYYSSHSINAKLRISL